MRYKSVTVIVFLTMGFSLFAYGFQYNVITPNVLKRKTHGNCAFIHFWASWCEICIKELPGLIAFLEKEKQVDNVIVDLTSPFAQEKFSKPWLKNRVPESTTYRRGSVNDDTLVKSVISNWNGGLPLSILFVNGKKKKEWKGSINTMELKDVLFKDCKLTP